jgi:hypothetical protein
MNDFKRTLDEKVQDRLFFLLASKLVVYQVPNLQAPNHYTKMVRLFMFGRYTCNQKKSIQYLFVLCA